MKLSNLNIVFVGLAALSLGACSTSSERMSGAGVGFVSGAVVAGPVGAVVGGVAGAVAGPTVAADMGIPHRSWRRRHHHHHHHTES